MYTHSRLVAEREVAFTLFTFLGHTWSTGLAPQRRDGGQSRYRTKVPVLIGESLKDFKTYQRAVKPRGCRSSEEDQKRLGPKLYRNLLGAKTSVSIFIEQLDPALLTGTDGPAKLLAELENGRFQKTGFQELRSETWRLSIPRRRFPRTSLGIMHSRTADFLEKSNVWCCPAQRRLATLRGSVRR